MKVQKRIATSDPGYPNRRQFSQYGRLLAGVATIGLGAAVGQSGEDVRLGGDIVVSPRAPDKPTRTMGRTRCEPLPSGTSTNLPVATTNPPPAAAANTNKPVAAPPAPGTPVRQIRGEMPAEPKEHH
jgi:hypothetical protein